MSETIFRGGTSNFHSRRDHVFIYAGPRLGATVKGPYKGHWISPDPVGEASGIPWTGIENAPPEVQNLGKPEMDLQKLPFDPLEYIEHLDQLPFDPDMDPALGN